MTVAGGGAASSPSRQNQQFLAPASTSSLPADMADQLVHFKHLSDEGLTLIKQGRVQQVQDAPEISFTITSPQSLLDANLAIQNLAHRIILGCSAENSTDELTDLEKRRITQSKFLAPNVLSQRTNGQIPIETGILLITCLGLKKNQTMIPVSDLKTGELNANFQNNVFEAGHKLVLIDPNDQLEEVNKLITSFISSQTHRKIVLKIINQLTDALPWMPQLYSELFNTHNNDQITAILTNLNDYFPEQEPQTIVQLRTDIEDKIQQDSDTSVFWDPDEDIQRDIFRKKIQDQVLSNMCNCLPDGYLPEEGISIETTSWIPWVDTENVYQHLEDYFSEQDRQTIIQKKTDRGQIQQGIDLGKRVTEMESFSNEEFDKYLKISEVYKRVQNAEKIHDDLKGILSTYQQSILDFLKEVSRPYTIATPQERVIKWQLQGVEILEDLVIPRSCIVSRRVRCPDMGNERPDLTYFDSDPNKKTVASVWRSLGGKYQLSDPELVNFLFAVYRGESVDSIEEEVKTFLSFLVILLLGKEPAYDAASYGANFIYLLSIRNGIHSFEEALRQMPLIPQGAIAAKQFLLQTTGRQLDAVSCVQPRGGSSVEKSAFLPFSNTFLGSAENGIKAYDYVGYTALSCVQRQFCPDIDAKDPALLKLKQDLMTLFEIEELDLWEIPRKLHFFWEERNLCRSQTNNQELQHLIDQKNRYAFEYLQSKGETVTDQNAAADQCARFLTKGINRIDPNVHELVEIQDREEREFWVERVLSDLRIPPKETGIYPSIKRTLETWDPLTSFQAKNIDPLDTSESGMQEMYRVWGEHLTTHLSSYQHHPKYGWLLETLYPYYRPPVTIIDLPAAIDPVIKKNLDGPISKWAISYLLKDHPLQREIENTLQEE